MKFLLFIPLLLCGCMSQSGPFVTNISSDGRGNLIIEKNMVQYNKAFGTVGTAATPTVQTLRIFPDPVTK